MSASAALSSRHLVLQLALVQFINVVDFMMVLPLGPDLAEALGFSVTYSGYVGGAYSFASACIGFIATLFIDHTARKRALLVCLGGLVLATLATTLATSLYGIMALRVLAGLFGGPLWALCSAVIADEIAPEQRGRAIGALMGSFSAASVLGVPFGLQLAHWYGWQSPFIVISIMGALVWLAVWRFLPYHAPIAAPAAVLARLQQSLGMMASRVTWATYGCSVLGMMAGFMLIPAIPAYVQMNFGYPREQLGLLYLAGGCVTFFTQRFAGWLVDRTSATRASIIFAVIFIINLVQAFVLALAWVPVMLSFVLFMVSMSGRGVAAQTLATKVPPPQQRAAFMAAQGAFINIATASGAFISTLVLVESNGRILHADMLALFSIALSLLVPFLFWYVERHVTAR